MEINLNVLNAKEIEPGKTYALEVLQTINQQQAEELAKAFRAKTGADVIILVHARIGLSE
jgi:maltose-binding protein MalE